MAAPKRLSPAQIINRLKAEVALCAESWGYRFWGQVTIIARTIFRCFRPGFSAGCWARHARRSVGYRSEAKMRRR